MKHPPPHGRNPVIFDGPCDCDDCNDYHRWEGVAEDMDCGCPKCGAEWDGRRREGSLCFACRCGQ